MNKEVKLNVPNIFEYASHPVSNYILIGLIAVFLIFLIYLLRIRKMIISGKYKLTEEQKEKKVKIFGNISYVLLCLIVGIILAKFINNINI